MTGAHFCSCVSRRWRLHFRRSGRAGRDCEFVGGGRKFLRLCEHDVAEQIGGANGDEPFSSVSIATSAMAHPRRSPLAFGAVMNTAGSFLSVPEAQRLIHDPELTHGSRKVMAAATLMEYCEHDLQITLDDMLRCLDYGGTIATMGARCLYVRTGRDGLGWAHAGSNGLPFVVDRTDWESYLREHYPTNTAEQTGSS